MNLEMRDKVEESIERRARTLLASKGHTPGPKMVSFVRDSWFCPYEDWDDILQRASLNASTLPLGADRHVSALLPDHILTIPSSVPFVYVFASNDSAEDHPLWRYAIEKPNNIACLHMRIKRSAGDLTLAGPADDTVYLREYLKHPGKCSFGSPGYLKKTSPRGYCPRVSDHYEDDLVQRLREATIRGDPSCHTRRVRTPSPPPAPIALPPYFRFVNDK